MVASLRAIGTCLVASLVSYFVVLPASAENYPLIIKGKVTMSDGSPPPFSVGIETVCSDTQGSAPGPLTNKKGEYLWRMDVDPLRSRSCVIRATHSGYVSTSIDISALNGYTSTTTTLDPIVITSRAADPYAIFSNESGVPSKTNTAWRAAIKAYDAHQFNEAVTQLQTVVAGAPKFAPAWHAMGVMLDRDLQRPAEARPAYEHAIEADPKSLPSYIALTRLCIKMKDWQGAAKTADALIKMDSKKVVTEVYLHQAVAQYGLKDLAGAETSVQEAIRLKIPRAEYVLGRILQAKGDAAGAREHITKYLEEDKSTPDAALIRAQLELIGKPEAKPIEPELLELEF